MKVKAGVLQKNLNSILRSILSFAAKHATAYCLYLSAICLLLLPVPAQTKAYLTTFVVDSVSSTTQTTAAGILTQTTVSCRMTSSPWATGSTAGLLFTFPTASSDFKPGQKYTVTLQP